MLGFRVWDSVNQEFAKGWFYIDEIGDLWKDVGDGLGTVDKKRLIPMQSTGFKDSSNKKIFQGDIISIDVSYNKELTKDVYWLIEDIWEIPFHFEFDICEINFGLKHIKVIGNKYENPELLESINAGV